MSRWADVAMPVGGQEVDSSRVPRRATGRLIRSLGVVPLTVAQTVAMSLLLLGLVTLAVAWVGVGLLADLDTGFLPAQMRTDAGQLSSVPGLSLDLADRSTVRGVVAPNATDGSGIASGGDLPTRLLVFMALALIAGATSVGISRKLSGVVTAPLAAARLQLVRIAEGDFSGRLPVTGQDEIGRLSADLNYMTSELERLYRVERDGRVAAEAIAARERELAAAKEFWAHTIVHDLRGPLSVIAGFAELLDAGRLGELSSEQRAALLQISGASVHVIGQVQDILDVFRLEQSALTLSGQRLSVSAVLESAAAAARQPDRPEEIRIGLVSGCAAEVFADRRLLLRALDNLLQNAYKYAGSRARIALTAQQGPDGLITFAVDDDGPGIPPAARERVFRAFTQGSTGAEGAGLGLTFCCLVAKAHGGRMWVETSPLGGASVRLAISPGPSVGQLALTDLPHN